jgi:hypothetical protein
MVHHDPPRPDDHEKLVPSLPACKGAIEDKARVRKMLDITASAGQI